MEISLRVDFSVFFKRLTRYNILYIMLLSEGVFTDTLIILPTDFTLRLVDGVEVKATETSGLVEVWRSEWRSVCDDKWTDEDADVVCKELGFLGFR